MDSESLAKTSAMINQALLLQERDIRMLEDIHKEIVSEIKPVGEATLLELDRQEQKLYQIKNNMEDINHTLRESKQTLRAIGRKLTTDICIRVTAGIVLLVIIATIIVVLTIKPKK